MPDTSVTGPHLWEVDHDSYCAEGNYFEPDECHLTYRTWGEFLEAEGDANMNLNLVFRWDWDKPEQGVMGTLTVFWVGQHKALLRSTSVSVHPDEEPAVRAWLAPRFEHLMRLWAPLAPGAAA